MKEVEIKIGVENLEKILELLETKGCKFGEPVSQRDSIFIPQAEPTVPVSLGTNVLRVRREKERTLFTLKQGQELAKTERELQITDPAIMEEIIIMLGFKKIAQINKVRRKCRVGELEICADEVEGLGSFVEVEKITAEAPEKVQAELLNLLTGFGVDVSKRVSVGYDILYVQKYGPARV